MIVIASGHGLSQIRDQNRSERANVIAPTAKYVYKIFGAFWDSTGCPDEYTKKYLAEEGYTKPDMQTFAWLLALEITIPRVTLR